MTAGELIDQTPLLLDYDVKFYHFDLHISKDTTYLSGSVAYLAEVVAASLDTFAVEFIDEMTLDSVRINETTKDFIRIGDEVFVPLNTPLQQGDLFTCRFYYRGTPPEGNFFIGVSKGTSEIWDQPVVWTLAEPFNARQWWPAKQILDDKADSVWVFLTTEAGSKAGSIGLLENIVPLPDNRVRYEWKSRYPIAYYLISYAVADYQEYNLYSKPAALGGDSILVQNYIYDSPGCLEQYKEGIDRTVPLIELFSDLYSLYPFHEEKYGHCLTELSGGMEHQTMTTIGSFGLGIVAHELAHMWFGDNVTCATWSDIWVNEGFATYSDYLAHEKLADPQWYPIWLRNAHDYILSEPGGSVYVPEEEVQYGNESRIFSGRLSYYKGAYLLHMIRYELDNDDLFFAVLRDFQEIFRDSVATSQDFIDVLNATSGMDFTGFFEQWFFGEGYPIYNIDWMQTGSTFELASAQTASAEEITPFFTMKYPVRIYLDDGTDTTIEILQTQPLVVKTVHISKGVDSIQVDPDLWVLKRVGSINAIPAHGHQPVMRIFPNPAMDRLHVQTNARGKLEVTIYGPGGQKFMHQSGSGPEVTIDISGLAVGMYFLSASSDRFRMDQKFIKQ
jgi:aminopeptidase N